MIVPIALIVRIGVWRPPWHYLSEVVAGGDVVGNVGLLLLDPALGEIICYCNDVLGVLWGPLEYFR